MSQSTTYDVVGIGNALVDVLSHEDDGFIDAHDLTKGSMTLIEDDRVEELYAAMGHRTEMSGGSAANTLVGVASLRRSGGLHRPGARRRPGHGVRPRPRRRSRSTSPRPAPPTATRHRALPDRGHARRPAHHEHLPRAPRRCSAPTTSTSTWCGPRRSPSSRATCSTGTRPRPPTGSPPRPPTRPVARSRSPCPTASASTATATTSSP